MPEQSAFAIGAVILLSFAVSVLLTPLLGRYAPHWGLLDQPSARSSHDRVMSRGGGIAIVVALAVCLAATRSSWAGLRGAGALMAGLVLIAAVGVLDDRFGLPPLSRLAVHLAAAAILVRSTGGLERAPLPAPLDVVVGPGAVPLAVLWIVAVVNFYNFLDGIDGLASLQGVITGLGVALAGWDPAAVVIAAALAGGCLGFLPFNWSPARIFLGDVGSGVLGYTFAALPFLVPPPSRERAVFFVAMSLWLFLADATWTLLKRGARRRRLHQAHRDHLYQQLVDSGWGHGRVAAILGAGSAALTLMALLTWSKGGAPWAWATVLLALALLGLEWATVRRRRPRTA